ncbi:MAG: hypothetical protein JNJ57_04340, partial [Saprospiraceae bacterium]|nr:hypothetical protein [Saprospiraceae bacterium]
MKHFRHVKILFLLALPVIFYFSSCKQEVTYTNLPLTHAYNAKVYLKWNDKFLELDRYAKGNRPGSGPRVLAYMGLSAYESVVGGMPENNSLAFLFPGLSLPAIENDKEYYWPACINESYAFLMKRFLPQVEDDYPDLFAGIDLLYNQLHQEYAAETTPEILERSEAYGRAVAQAVYEWEKTDLAGHNAYLNIQPTNYQPPVGPGLWQPTWPDYGAAVFPYWGDVRTFALKGDELISRAPLPYSESETSPFFLQAMETYSTVNNINANGAG